MPRLSIIIPVLGNLKRLEDTLVSVLENRPADSQIIVVLDQPYDDPYDLEDEVCFLQTAGKTNLAGSTNLGIESSRSPIVHVLGCGTRVREGWAEVALERFDDPSVASVAPLVLDPDEPDRIQAAGVAYRLGGAIRRLGSGKKLGRAARYEGKLTAPHVAAAFYRRSVFRHVDYFAREFGRQAAIVDWARRLEQSGMRTVLEPGCQVIADRELEGSAFRRSLEAERLFWRWSRYRGWPWSLIPHAWTVSLDCLASLPYPRAAARFAGRLIGLFSARSQPQARIRSERYDPADDSDSGILRMPHFHEDRESTHFDDGRQRHRA